MTPERWREVSGIVDAALDLPAAERAAFVARACASDEARRDVERYLDACVRSTSFLSEDVGAYAGALIGRRDRHARYEEASVLERFAVALAPRYRIERELGRGGMAIVYLAHDVRHGRRVAVKVLRPELAAALGAERFLREIETAARLTHPHVLPLLDSGAAHGQLYYVMPYVEGESLRERLRREGQLPLEDARRIARELASALDYAHRHNVLHRDLKPENVLLADGQAVVTDFGIARAISRAAASTEDGSAPATLTATGLSLGTPAYMSPEQAAGSRELDARSDVYALGCVLYEMLAGQPPFTGPTVESVVRQHLLMPARRLSVTRPEIPPAVDSAVSRALAKKPADRFASMADFTDAVSGADGTERPPPSPPRHPLLHALRDVLAKLR